MTVGPQHRDGLIHGLEPIADGAVADQPARQRFPVKPFIHVGPVIHDSGSQQHGLRCRNLGAERNLEAGIRWPYIVDFGGDRLHPMLADLFPHASKQFRAGDPARKNGLIVRRWNPARPAFFRVQNQNFSSKSREIESGCKPGRAASDDDAVKGWFVR